MNDDSEFKNYKLEIKKRLKGNNIVSFIFFMFFKRRVNEFNNDEYLHTKLKI